MKRLVRCLIVACLGFCLCGSEVVAADAPVFRLDALNIDAERSAVDLWDVAWNAETVQKKTLELRYSPTPNEALRMNSSVSLVRNTKGMTYAPSLRGFSGWTTQVLINGTPANMPFGNFPNLTALPIRGLSSVSVVKGSQSILYGPNGLAGAINMRLPTAVDLPGFRLKQEIGGQGQNRQELYYGRVGEDERWQHLFGITTEHRDGHQQHSHRDFESFLYRGSMKFGDGYKLSLSFLEVEGVFEMPYDGNRLPEKWMPWLTTHKDLVLQRDLRGGQQWSARAYQNSEFVHFFVAKDNGFNDYLENGTQNQLGRGAEVLYNFSIGERQRIALGVDKREDVISTTVLGGSRDCDTTGLFVRDQFNLNDKLALQGTFRHNDHSTAGTENTYSFGADWRAAPKHRLSVNTGRSLRYPSLRELYMQFQNLKNTKNNTYSPIIPLQGNPDTKAETAKDLDITWKWDFRSDWYLSVCRFAADITDQIDSAPNPLWTNKIDTFQRRFANISKVKSRGWESRIGGKLRPALDVWLAHTRQELFDDEATNTRLENRPNYKLTAGLLWEHKKDRAQLIAERSGQSSYLARQLVNNKAVMVPATVDETTRLDLTWEHRLGSFGTLTLSVENLTDAENEAGGHDIGFPKVLDTPRRYVLGLETTF